MHVAVLAGVTSLQVVGALVIALGTPGKILQNGKAPNNWELKAILPRNRSTTQATNLLGTVDGTVGVGQVVVVLERVVRPQQVLRLHLAAQAGDVARAKVLAQLLHLLQLEQVYSQHLQRLYHQSVQLAVVRQQGALFLLQQLYKGLQYGPRVVE